MNDAQRQAELYGKIWSEDPNYGTAARDVRDTVAHRIYPHMKRTFPHFDEGQEIYVIDFGAGDGRFLYELERSGLLTIGTGVDVYEPQALPGWIRWERVPMWESTARGNYAISTDALEHLPPDRVLESLCRIADAAPHGFLRISLKEDHYGTERGYHLHETVWPADKWLKTLRSAGIEYASYRVYFEGERYAALEVWY